MKKQLLSVSIATIFCVVNVYGQLQVGETAPDFTFTDMNGNTQNLYTYLNQGKTVVLDISATWCGPCWSYHKSGALETFYEDEGPNGTNKAMVLFIEGDKSTPDAAMQGTGGNTQGNWLQGTPYPMCNPPSGTAFSQFYSGYKIPFFPTVYIVCPDKKIAISPTTSNYAFSTSVLKSTMNSKCKTTTGIDATTDINNSLSVYPTISKGNIFVSSNNNSNASIKVYNTLGALLYQTSVYINNSAVEVNLKDLSDGIYIVTIQSENNIMSKKIVIMK